MTKFPSQEEMDAAWAEADAKVSGHIRKLESHQFYAGDGGLAAYRETGFESVRSSAVSMFESDISYYTTLLRRRVLFTRLRIVGVPLNEYSKFEFLTYKVGTRYGERVAVLDQRLVPSHIGPLEDFSVFDDFLVIINYFDPAGNHLGSSFSRDKQVIADRARIFDELLNLSVPLGHFEASSSAYLDQGSI